MMASKLNSVGSTFTLVVSDEGEERGMEDEDDGRDAEGVESCLRVLGLASSLL